MREERIERINNARAIREAAAWGGTSLWEMGNRLGCRPERLADGLWPLQLVAEDVGATMEQMYEWGHE